MICNWKISFHNKETPKSVFRYTSFQNSDRVFCIFDLFKRQYVSMLSEYFEALEIEE